MSKIISFIVVLLIVFSGPLNPIAADNQQLDIKSNAAVLLDSETGAVLYDKNGEKKMYPASLTKIATAIYAIEKGNLDDIVTVSNNAVNADGTRVYLVEGEKVTLRKLLQGMLINSGNDAAIAIAEHLDVNVEEFAANLNTYLKQTIGVKNTNFTNPNGLFNENHYTTAMDLAIITNYAMKNPVFKGIFGTKELKWNGQSWNTTLLTHHLMLKGEIPYPGITGGKTGYIDESKQTLATTADNGNIKLTVIELNAQQKKDIYNDTIHLLDYGFNDFQHHTLLKIDPYKIGEVEYYPLKDTVITEPINGTLAEVNKNGILTVKNGQSHVIQEVQLYAKKEKPILKNKNIKSDTNQNFHINSFYGIAIFGLIGIVLTLRNKITKKV